MKYNNVDISFIKYMFKSLDLFSNFDLKKLNVSRKMLKRSYSNGSELRLWCSRIYIYFLYLVILDIIRNNITFISSKRKKLILAIEILKGKELLKYLKNSDSKMYNYITSEYKYPRIKLFYKTGKNYLTREILLNYSLTKEFFDNINKGNIYG